VKRDELLAAIAKVAGQEDVYAADLATATADQAYMAAHRNEPDPGGAGLTASLADLRSNVSAVYDLAKDAARAIERQAELAVGIIDENEEPVEAVALPINTKTRDLKRLATAVALDGQAHHVFNTLRGADDVITLDDETSIGFADVRAILAGGK
jgi:hypothetical protein